MLLGKLRTANDVALYIRTSVHTTSVRMFHKTEPVYQIHEAAKVKPTVIGGDIDIPQKS